MTLSGKTVLIAGAGFVSQPVGDVLVKENVNVIYGCRNIATAQKTAKAVGSSAKAIALDVHNKEQLSQAVANCDLVVSLVPPPDHPLVVEVACEHKKNVLTTSYVSPEIEALEGKIKEAGIVVMNELGLDPGFDHLWAVKCLTDIKEAGGKCTSFESYCGGLPAPEDSDNALGYRFSWSSAGVLRALGRVAKYKEDGLVVEKSGVSLMESAKSFVTPYKGYAFECYANGDSLPYDTRYPALSDATTITHKAFLSKPISWAEATSLIIGSSGPSEEEAVKTILSKHNFTSPQEQGEVIRRLRQMGLFRRDLHIVPQSEPSPFYTLCKLLEQQGEYGAHQRDLVFLQHTFHVTKQGGQKSIVNATLIEYGSVGGYSAMAKLVGIPAAVGCKAILEKKLPPGLLRPTTEEIARPLREVLEREYDIKMNEVEVLL